MKIVLLVAFAIALVAADPFGDFVMRYNKAYPIEEIAQRRANFAYNLRVIEETNAQNLSYTLAVNEWSDLSWDEFKAQNLMAPQHCSATGQRGNYVSEGVPPMDDPAIDWRTKGVVTPVKNQGGCGSCWCFGTSGSLESMWAISTGTLLSLAEQQLVDCAGAFGNQGCNGGLPSQAFEYIKSAGGMMLGKDYPYTARDGRCRFDASKAVAKVTGEVNITQGSETELFDAITNKGPVAIAFQVAGDFQSYHSGVYDSTRCRSGPMDVNHAVLAVGYGTDTKSTKPYWIVKNSWGTNFGMQGYFLMVRNKNMCGVATCASYPLVK